MKSVTLYHPPPHPLTYPFPALPLPPQQTFKVNTQGNLVTYYTIKAAASRSQLISSVRERATTTEARERQRDLLLASSSQYQVVLDPASGRVSAISRAVNGGARDVVRMDHNLFWYNSSDGDKASDQTSGAYIFRPARLQPFNVTTGMCGERGERKGREKRARGIVSERMEESEKKE